MESAYAIMHGGRIHTLQRACWQSGDHRRAFKWDAHVDGEHWRFFKTKGEWELAAGSYHRHVVRGPYYESTMRAVCWSEHEGRVALDRLG